MRKRHFRGIVIGTWMDDFKKRNKYKCFAYMIGFLAQLTGYLAIDASHNPAN